jgi:hypothetical protein
VDERGEERKSAKRRECEVATLNEGHYEPVYERERKGERDRRGGER